MPRQWYNVRADMKNKPAPLLNPATLQPLTLEEMEQIFCRELAMQELDDTTPYIDIPVEIRDFYKMYRPSPLVRASCLEKKLDTPAKIYYKFEGNNTSGSHKLNSAIAQAYYAKKQGLKGVTTETGAGQWGTALSMVSAELIHDLICGCENPAAALFSPSRFSLPASGSELMKTVIRAVDGIVLSKLRPADGDVSQLERGDAMIVTYRGRKTGAYLDTEGKLHLVGPVCP